MMFLTRYVTDKMRLELCLEMVENLSNSHIPQIVLMIKETRQFCFFRLVGTIGWISWKSDSYLQIIHWNAVWKWENFHCEQCPELVGEKRTHHIWWYLWRWNLWCSVRPSLFAPLWFRALNSN
jgi:hypothetical protein